jgi:dihydrofolate reductase
MGRLLYIANVSLDGYTEDKEGKFDWTAPNDDVFRFITNLMRADGTHLYGRRMYETMMVWETDPRFAAESPLMNDFAEVWQSAGKIVYSSTLASVSTRNTQLERNFDPEYIRHLKETVDHDILIGGPGLASHAFRSGLVDEYQLFIYPLMVGGGKQALQGGVKLNLELLEDHHFSNGVVYLRYRILPASET